MLADWMYAVEVVGADGVPLNAPIIERRLRAVVRDARKRLADGERAVPVGVLTTDERDHWADVSVSFPLRSAEPHC